MNSSSRLNVAGIDPDNIEITYTDNNLSIKGEVSSEHEENGKEGRYHLRERRAVAPFPAQSLCRAA